MQYRGHSVMALALGLALSTEAYAADGIKATGTAMRALPADIATISFQTASASGGTAEEAALTKAFESKGLQVLESTGRFAAVGANNRFGYSISPSPATGADIQKQQTFRVKGFKRIVDVFEVLGQNGVSQNVTVQFESSKYEEVRGVVQKEAIENAIDQGRVWARDAGVKAGSVIDLTIAAPFPFPLTPAGIQVSSPSILVTGNWIPDQNLIEPKQEGELPQIKYSVTASVVLAVKPE